ncbi:MAG: hypothetical protein SGBAC_007284 [Bacillariaceae sp.]
MEDTNTIVETIAPTATTTAPEMGAASSPANEEKPETEDASTDNANTEKASTEDSNDAKKESSSSSSPQTTPAQPLAAGPSLKAEGNEEASSGSDHKNADTNTTNENTSVANGDSKEAENNVDAVTNEETNDASNTGLQSGNNSTASDTNDASNVNPQQLQAINAYNNFMTQAAAAGAANNSQQYGMLNAPAPAPLVPDATNAPLITTLLLSVANQQPGLVPQVTNNTPAPPAETPAATATAATPTVAATVAAPAVATAPVNTVPTLAQAPSHVLPTMAPAPQMLPNMGLPYHPATNMFPLAFLLPQQMAMQQQQQQLQQRFAFAPGAAGPALTIPQGLQLPQMAANNFIPFNVMAALQQQQAQHGHPQQMAQMGQAQFMPVGLPQSVAGTSAVFAPATGVPTVDGTVLMEASSPNNGRTLPLYLEYDDRALTEYQCLLRQQIELFEATEEDVRGSAQGRHTRIRLGQVGYVLQLELFGIIVAVTRSLFTTLFVRSIHSIRCRHCAHLPKPARARGAVYYSKTIDGMYQVAQNMSKLHLIKQCHKVPPHIKNKLVHLQKSHTRASGGKEYWAEGLRVLGVIEIDGMLTFKSSSPEKAQPSPAAAAQAPPPVAPTTQPVTNAPPIQLQPPQQIIAPPPSQAMQSVMVKPVTMDGDA